MTDLKNIEKVANEFGNDLEKVQKELKRIQSAKCRLKNQKGRASYESDMTKILQEEQIMKEVRNLLDPKEKTVTTFEQSDVDLLDYDETVKAIKSIQSKMCNTRWLTTTEGDNDEFRNAERIYKMLAKHRDEIRPVEETVVRKTELLKIIETIESNHELSQERIVELLRGLI